MSFQFYQKDQAFPELKRNLPVDMNSVVEIVLQLNKLNFLHLSKNVMTIHMMILVRQRSLQIFGYLEALSKIIENIRSL